MRQSGGVCLALFEVFLSLGIVAFGYVQGSESKCHILRARRFRYLGFGILRVSVDKGEQAEVRTCLWRVAAERLRLLKIAFCSVHIALGYGYGSKVVVGAVVLVIESGGCLVNLFLLCLAVLEGGSVEQFISAELRSVACILRLYLIVAASDGLVIDDKARATELGQDAVGEFLESCRHVADLLFTLLGVFIHRQYAQDDILVLEV